LCKSLTTTAFGFSAFTRWADTLTHSPDVCFFF
jgi:hypothetical protein